MAVTFSIRPVTTDDRAAVAALWSQTLGEPISAETLAGWEALHIAGEHRLRLVAEVGRRVVGAIAVVRRDDEADAYLRLFVERDHRRGGIGDALLTRAMQFARDVGSRALVGIGCTFLGLSIPAFLWAFAFEWRGNPETGSDGRFGGMSIAASALAGAGTVALIGATAFRPSIDAQATRVTLGAAWAF